MRIDRKLRREFGAFYQRALRPLLPLRGHVRYNGVIVADVRAGDGFAPKHGTPDDKVDIPDYESGLMRGLRQQVRSGETVVVVGGGLGVTVAEAAKLVCEQGRVVCFEGSPTGARQVLGTAALNGVQTRVAVTCATVGADVGVYQRKGEETAPVVSAKELPACDVLELDCEGAELTILREMTLRPRVILVESHGALGASSEAVRELLRALGYTVSELGVAEPRMRELCEANDVRVLCGVLK